MSEVNYTFKSIEPEEKVASYGNFILHFKVENNFTVNIKPMLLEFYDLDDPNLNYHAKQIMLMLIKDYGCLPSVDQGNAIEELLRIRKNSLAKEYRKSLELEIMDVLDKRKDIIDNNSKNNEVTLVKAQEEVEKKFSEARVMVGGIQAEIAEKMSLLKKVDDEEKKAILQKEIVDLQAKQTLKVDVLERMSGEVGLVKQRLIEKQKEGLSKKLEPLDSQLSKLQTSLECKFLAFCKEISSKDSDKIEKINKIIMEVDEKDEK